MLILNKLGVRISRQLSSESPDASLFSHRPPGLEDHPVSELAAADLAASAVTLVRAFEQDPMTPYLFGSSVQGGARLRFVFEAELHYAFRHGMVETIDRGSAVAIWLPPRKSEDETEAGLVNLIKSWPVPTLFRLGPGAIGRGIRLLRVLQELRSISAPREHWYLLALGVHPERQGKGWGSALVRNGIARAQHMNLPCYLETTNRRNISFYQRNGFKLVGSSQVAGGSLTVWGMLNPSPLRF